MSNLSRKPEHFMNANQMSQFKSTRTMPQWVVNDTPNRGLKPPPLPPLNDRNKPPPLPKKNHPDPDYEVIEFGNQQYSNASPIKPEPKQIPAGLKCGLCGSSATTVKCEQCPQSIFCSSCDDMFHRHSKRQNHLRKFIDKNFKPPLPMKGAPSPPVPPPRRNKKFNEWKPQEHGGQLQPPPSPALSLRERMGTITRMINPSNRPLPPPPQPANQRQIQQSPPNLSRIETPNKPPHQYNHHPPPLNTLRRAPSLTMERIQNQNAATLDRMSVLQQRYRQHQEAMRSDGERSRRTSIASEVDVEQKLEMLRQRQRMQVEGPQGRNMSASVINLSQINQAPPPNPGWNSHQMQQAQSMAQLNQINPNQGIGWHQQDQLWGNDGQMSSRNGSNMSLNLPQQGYFYPQSDQMRPPQVWLNTWGAPPPAMYPYPMGMVPMSPAPPRARMQSRNTSRAASPALSQKSRRSMLSNRRNYPRDPTDDEDSDLSDQEFVRSNRNRRESQPQKLPISRRTRKNSGQGFDFDDDNSDLNFVRETDARSTSGRSNRGGSITRIVNRPLSPKPKLIPPALPMKKEKIVATTKSVQKQNARSESESDRKEALKSQSSEEEEEVKKEEEEEEEENQEDYEEELKEMKIINTNGIQNKVNSNELEIVEDHLGPPPSAPDHDWECEHCTFVNEANTQICMVCCKTQTLKQKNEIETIKVENKTKTKTQLIKKPENKILKKPIKSTISTTEDDSEDTGKKKEKENQTKLIVSKKSEINNENDNEKQLKKVTQKIVERATIITKIDDIISNSETSSSSMDDDNDPFQSRTNTIEKKPAALKILKECPPPVDSTTIKKESVSVSTGTSPPPQNMSTQTYDVLPLKIEEVVTNNRERPSGHGLRRSYSMATSGTSPLISRNDLQRSQSRQSFSSDTQSLPLTPPPRELSSPINNLKHPIDDEAFAYINRALHSYGIPTTPYKDDMHRSNGDLGRRSRRVSTVDFTQKQRAQQIDDNLTIEDIIAMQRQETMGPSGMELIRLLKEAEQYKFSAEDVQAGLIHCGNANPILWLKENWSKLIETVQGLSTKYGHDRKENIIGTISAIEAREALRFHKGNVWRAVTECIEQRQKKYNEISSRGHYSREDIVTSLTANHGNLELALIELGKTQLKPFLMRIWGPPAGAENESGNFFMDENDRNSDIYYDDKDSSKPIDRTLSSLSDNSIVSENRETLAEEMAESLHNSNLLRDIETLIGNMENNQAKQNENMLKNIESLLGNVLAKQERSQSSASNLSSLSYDRLNMKSPIVFPKTAMETDEQRLINNDIRNFVSQHIQDIVPNLVEHVQQELQTEVIGKNSEIINFKFADEESSSDEKDDDDEDEIVIAIENIAQVNQPIINEIPEQQTYEVKPFVPVITVPEIIESIIDHIQPKEILSISEVQILMENNENYPVVSSNSSNEEPIKLNEPKNNNQQQNMEIIKTVQPKEDNPNTVALKPDTYPFIVEAVKVQPNLKRRLSRIPVKKSSIVYDKNRKLSMSKQISQESVEDSNTIAPTSNSFSGEYKQSTEILDTTNQGIKIGQATIILKTVTVHQTLEPTGSKLVNDAPGPSGITSIIPPISKNDQYSSDEDVFDDSEEFVHQQNNTNQEHSEKAITLNEIPISEETSSVVPKAQQNLSELVMDTQKLIQQMKDEINSDIASMVSDEEYSENESSRDWTDSEESVEDEEFEPQSEDLESGWSDVSSNYDSNGEADINVEEKDENLDEIPLLEPEIQPEAIPVQENEELFRSQETIGDNEGLSQGEVTDVSDLTTEIGPAIIEQIIEPDLRLIQNEGELNIDIPIQLLSVESKNTIDFQVTNETTSNIPVEVPIAIQTVTVNSVERDITVEVPILELLADARVEFPVESNQINEEHDEQEIITKTENPIIPYPAGSIQENTGIIQADNNIQVNVIVKENSPEKSAQPVGDPSLPSTTEKVPTTPKVVRKIPVRKRSITNNAPLSLKTDNIKAMQNKFLDKSKPEPKLNNKPFVVPKVPTKGFIKSSISTIANKFTKTVSPQNSHQSPTKPQSNLTTKPSTSKPIQKEVDTSSSSSKPSTSKTAAEKEDSNIQKKQKKKYIETCFSDEYPTSDEEDIKPKAVFVPNVKSQTEEEEKPESLARRLVAEETLTLAEAELMVALMNLKFDKDAAIWASKECYTIDEAMVLLEQDCELCLGKSSMNQMISMLKCTHKCCKDCAKNYFTIQITDRAIHDCNCPYCKMPELHDMETQEDELWDYFKNLDVLLKNILDENVYELFQRKLRDQALAKDPYFKWCVQCSSGFIARPKQKRLICPDCGSTTCASCRKPWEKQHEGISCELFEEWKKSNDPDNQAQGVTQHLQIHGIDCPKCKFRYDLARGGCMHFTCTQCKFEFCFGCGKKFMMGAKCGVSNYCAKLGLHSHHPRNCLFYLRDKEPHQLQNLLKINNVPFETESLEKIKTEDKTYTIIRCPIAIQKETPSGLIDVICSDDVVPNNGGLCRQHYVEYLVNIVYKSKVDPLPILDLTDCMQELRRRGIDLPERGPWDTDPIYLEMCQKIVEEQIPLESG